MKDLFYFRGDSDYGRWKNMNVSLTLEDNVVLIKMVSRHSGDRENFVSKTHQHEHVASGFSGSTRISSNNYSNDPKSFHFGQRFLFITH